MRVLTFASQKGGSGKTTLAGHIAVQAEAAGAGPVALIDTDPQGSLSDWWSERESETPAFAHTSVSELASDLGELNDMGIKLVVIDTPPAITSMIENVIKISELVVIPTRPSPHDLRAAGATVELVEALNTSMMFVVNAAFRRARITSEAAVALSQHGIVAPVTIHQRVDFASAMIDGRTVMELDPRARSSKEIVQLWDYMDAKLNKIHRTIISSDRFTTPRRKRSQVPDVEQAETA
jgi:chromosome partitioning protein